MEPKTATIVSGTLVFSLVVAIAILGACIGLKPPFFKWAAVCVAAILLVFFFLLAQFTALDRRRIKSMARRATIEGRQFRNEYSFLRKVAGVPVRFKHDALAAATDGFRSVVGRGSTSTVFRGILEDGTPVAVKRIESPGDSGDRAFRSEVSAIASVQHVNLVRLLGYCIAPDGPRFLVYEFINNGSLDHWIFPTSRRGVETGCLPWDLRYRVAVDVAKALAYLHHDCRHRILHLDVKPENILLDQDFNALVADFGLSKLMNKDQSRVVTSLRGTKGYLAPEWLLGNGITEKSDIYSYGMVLFELVGGRRNVMVVEEGGSRNWSYFPRTVMEKAMEGKFMEVVDMRLLGEVQEAMLEEVRMLVWVALWCVQEEATLRPSMATVVDMLQGRVEVGRPPETEMVIVDLLSLGESGQTRTPIRLPSTLQLQTPVLSTFDSIMSTLSGR